MTPETGSSVCTMTPETGWRTLRDVQMDALEAARAARGAAMMDPANLGLQRAAEAAVANARAAWTALEKWEVANGCDDSCYYSD